MSAVKVNTYHGADGKDFPVLTFPGGVNDKDELTGVVLGIDTAGNIQVGLVTPISDVPKGGSGQGHTWSPNYSS